MCSVVVAGCDRGRELRSVAFFTEKMTVGRLVSYPSIRGEPQLADPELYGFKMSDNKHGHDIVTMQSK